MVALPTARVVVPHYEKDIHRIELHFDSAPALLLALLELDGMAPRPILIENGTGHVRLTCDQYAHLEETLQALHLVAASPLTGHPARTDDPVQSLNFLEGLAYGLLRYMGMTRTPPPAADTP